MGGIRVAVEIGPGVNVGGMGDDVIIGEAGEEATAGAHPLIDTVINTNARIANVTDLFMLLSLLIPLCKTAPNGLCQLSPRAIFPSETLRVAGGREWKMLESRKTRSIQMQHIPSVQYTWC